jgi:hypothetical protein
MPVERALFVPPPGRNSAEPPYRAARWRMRAEVYRTIAAAMRNEQARGVVASLAETYERLAASEQPHDDGDRPDDATCLNCAEECERFAADFSDPGLRARILAIAQRWRRMAGQH